MVRCLRPAGSTKTLSSQSMSTSPPDVFVRMTDKAWSPTSHSSGTSPTPSRSGSRSEEHTSELQSRFDLVCRLLLEKKKKKTKEHNRTKQRSTGVTRNITI